MKIVNLLDICSPKQWKTVKQTDLSEKGYPCYSANGKIGFYKEYNHESPTLIIGCRGTCGSLHITEPFSYTSANAMALDNLNTNLVDIKFLFYFFRNRGFKDIITGSSQPQITRQGLQKMQIPIPTLEDQKYIVRTLDAADALTQKRKQAIALLDDYLKSVFLEMFGNPVENPKGWEVKKFGEIIEDIRYGSSEKSADFQANGSVAILRIPNILNGYVNYNDLKYQFLPEKEEKKLSLLQGDILFVRTNGNPDNIGRCAVFEINRKCVFASYLIRVRLKEDSGFNPVFIRYCLSIDSYRGKIRKESRTTAGNFNINTKGIKNFDLISPPKEKQTDFIRIMRNFESLKQSMFTQSKDLDTNFTALIQKAF